VVSSAFLHFGEERPLSGTGGSGTIFFGHCNLCCRFCQNHDISQPPAGETPGRGVSGEELAGIMIGLQRSGAHNINLVSPSHVIVPILEALVMAVPQGLRLPLVYNSGGYDSPVALELLDGIVDIYMPDMKFDDPGVARELSGPSDYPARNRAAVTEMNRQVGDLQTDVSGLATQGLLVRHLVLPGGLAGTGGILRFLADLSQHAYLNLLDQYRPCHRAFDRPPLDRPLKRSEWSEAITLAKELGLTRLDGV